MTITIDPQLFYRRVVKYLPRWAFFTVAGGVVIGQLLSSLGKIFKPFIDSKAQGVLELSALSYWEWWVIGSGISFVGMFVWRVVLRRKRSEFDKAEAQIQIIDMLFTQAQLTKEEKKFQWRGVIARMVGSIDIRKPSLGMPDLTTITKEVQEDLKAPSENDPASAA